ncbi:hypothetical protein FHX37_1350 [Haloactinospora alba]|uniref:Uncharacterized protein n=1 Tax=Haloactinospora alba TaxID=405555 RepID=A0A543NHW0_9ACTN|nr:hypothetical protein [Haloactinospora alba]TQN31446.1 hypothetical protein FHX37_1350 [Haloactinospora alba]
MSRDETKKPNIDVSMSQVAGGGLATLAAATAAAFLGVYGTIVGAAMMSVLSTVGTAVAQHYLRRSGDKAKGIAVRARRTSDHADPGSGSGNAGGGEAAGNDTSSSGGPAGTEGADTTSALPTVGAVENPHREGGESETEQPNTWRRWRGVAVTAVAVFVFAMSVILVFELVTGRTLSDTVHGNETRSGPSITGGNSTGQDQQQDPEGDPVPHERTPTTQQSETSGEDGTAPGDAPENGEPEGGEDGTGGEDSESVPDDDPSGGGEEPDTSEETPGSGEGQNDGEPPQDGQPAE